MWIITFSSSAMSLCKKFLFILFERQKETEREISYSLAQSPKCLQPPKLCQTESRSQELTPAGTVQGKASTIGSSVRSALAENWNWEWARPQTHTFQYGKAGTPSRIVTAVPNTHLSATSHLWRPPRFTLGDVSVQITALPWVGCCLCH